jgi:hypothetical protein
MTASGKANSEVFRRDLVLVWFHNAIGVSTGAHTGIGMVDNPRVPFKAWYLKDTIPVRYKPGADFDANSSAISIQELELAPRDIDELGLLDLGALIGVNVAL